MKLLIYSGHFNFCPFRVTSTEEIVLKPFSLWFNFLRIGGVLTTKADTIIESRRKII